MITSLISIPSKLLLNNDYQRKKREMPSIVLHSLQPQGSWNPFCINRSLVWSFPLIAILSCSHVLVPYKLILLHFLAVYQNVFDALSLVLSFVWSIILYVLIVFFFFFIFFPSIVLFFPILYLDIFIWLIVASHDSFSDWVFSYVLALIPAYVHVLV